MALNTDTLGEVKRMLSVASAADCQATCIADTGCGGWTFRQPSPNGKACKLLKRGAKFFANLGSGCGALGSTADGNSSSATPICTSGLVGWQLKIPTLNHPLLIVPIVPTAVADPVKEGGTLKLELFVDQQICEAFVHDGRGAGSAVATFACAPATPTASGVAVLFEDIGAVGVTGQLAEMHDSILPAPLQ